MEYYDHVFCGMRAFVKISNAKPERCANCGLELKPDQQYNTVPSPFVDDVENRASVLLKASKGDFLSSYQPGNDLHIGISTADGHVHSFWNQGLQCDPASDWHCAIELLTTESFGIEPTDWRSKLQTFCEQRENIENFKAEKYDETGHNCYDFVLGFLRSITPSDKDCGVFENKNYFVGAYVQKRIRTCWKYVTVLRQLAVRTTRDSAPGQ